MQTHLLDDDAEAIHREAALVGQHHLQGGGTVLRAVQPDGLGQFRQLLLGDALGRQQALVLLGVVAELVLEPGEQAGQLGNRVRIGLQVALLRGEQQAALAGLGVLEARHERFDVPQHVDGVGDAVPRQGAVLQGQVGRHRDEDHRQDGDHVTGQGLGREQRAGAQRNLLAGFRRAFVHAF